MGQEGSRGAAHLVRPVVSVLARWLGALGLAHEVAFFPRSASTFASKRGISIGLAS